MILSYFPLIENFPMTLGKYLLGYPRRPTMRPFWMHVFLETNDLFMNECHEWMSDFMHEVLNVYHKCMARNLKGPSASTSKSDRVSSPIGFITIQSFPFLNYNLMWEMTAKFKWKTHILSLYSQKYAFLFLFYFFFHYFSFFAFIFYMGLSPTGV